MGDMTKSGVLGAIVLPVLVFAGTNQEGRDFLEANKDKDGVITLPSGLQYKVLREGEGDAHPTASTPCDCHYEGKLINGDKFDSSYDRGSPTSFAPNQVIKGWTEAMQLMVEGDKWEMYIPSELGYGDSGSGAKIPGGSVLVFIMEIIKIKGETVPAQRCNPATLDKCSEKEISYIGKIKGKVAADSTFLSTELERLKGMAKKGDSMKPDLLAWITKRIGLIGKMKDEL